MSVLVFAPRRLFALFAADTRNVGRDPTLLAVVILSVLPALIVYFWGGVLERLADRTFGLSHSLFYALPFILALPGVLIGWLTGFLFLEDRDEGPLTALDVTPVGKMGFALYRVAITGLIVFVLTLFAVSLLVPEAGTLLSLTLGLLIGLEAVGSALVLPALARNKVEGLALTKLTNLLSLASLLALLPSPWRYLFGIFPTFWIGEIMGLGGPGLPAWAAMGLALAVHLAMVLLLYRLFAHRVG